MSAGPAATTDAPRATRIATLDVARGIAVLGTLGTNIWLFTDPDGPAGALTGVGAVEEVLRALTNGKFLALLTLLFGIGLELQYRSALRRGLRWPGRYLRRCGVLAAEGVLHYVLVFEYDVLLGYAITAVIVAFLVGRSPRTVRAWAVAVGTLHVVVIGAVTALLVAVPGASEVFARPVLAGAEGVYRSGSWVDQVLLRLAAWPVFRAEILIVVPLGLVLFLAGGALYRRGALADDPAGARLRRRLATVGLGVALPLDLGLALAGPAWFLLERYVVAPMVGVGLLAAIATLVLRARRRGPGRAQRALAELGRTALSGYVLQNVLASVLCYGWGLGLAVALDGLGPAARPWAVLGVWALVASVVLGAAVAWRRRFVRGPLESVMHRLV